MSTSENQLTGKVSVSDFARSVREQYPDPEYDKADDVTLARAVAHKFPEYSKMVAWGEPRSNDTSELIDHYSAVNGVDPELVRRMTSTESQFKPNAVSPKDAQGLMQLMPDTARSLGVTNSFDPKQNISGGIRYLKQQLDEFQDPTLAVAAYNAGPGRVRRSGGVPRIPETQNYVRQIMKGYAPPDRTIPQTDAVQPEAAPETPDSQPVTQEAYPAQPFVAPNEQSAARRRDIRTRKPSGTVAGNTVLDAQGRVVALNAGQGHTPPRELLPEQAMNETAPQVPGAPIAPPPNQTVGDDGLVHTKFDTNQYVVIPKGYQFDKQALAAKQKAVKDAVPNVVDATFDPSTHELYQIQPDDKGLSRSRYETDAGVQAARVRAQQTARQQQRRAQQQAIARRRTAIENKLFLSPEEQKQQAQSGAVPKDIYQPISLPDLKRADETMIPYLTAQPGDKQRIDEQLARQSAPAMADIKTADDAYFGVRSVVQAKMLHDLSDPDSGAYEQYDSPASFSNAVDKETQNAIQRQERQRKQIDDDLASLTPAEKTAWLNDLKAYSKEGLTRPFDEGIHSAWGNTEKQLGNLLWLLTLGGGAGSQSAIEKLKRNGRLNQYFAQLSQEQNDDPNAGFWANMRDGLLRGGGSALIELPKLIAGGAVSKVVGAAVAGTEGAELMSTANLSLQGALSADTLGGAVHNAVSNYLYQKGMSGTAPLGKIINAATWTALPTLEGVAEGKSPGESFGQALPLGLFSMVGAKRDRLMETLGYKAFTVRSEETRRNATVYVDENGNYLSLKTKPSVPGAHPERPIADVGEQTFDQITKAGKIGEWTRGRVSLGSGSDLRERFDSPPQSPRLLTGEVAPPSADQVKPALNDVDGEIVPSEEKSGGETAPEGQQPASPKAASVSAFITPSDQRRLSQLGYSEVEIGAMKPEEAQRIFQAQSPQPPQTAANQAPESAPLSLEQFIEQVHQPQVNAYLKAREKYELIKKYQGEDSPETINAKREMEDANAAMGSQFPEAAYESYLKSQPGGQGNSEQADAPINLAPETQSGPQEIAPLPENTAAIKAQLDAVRAGRKPALLITPGTEKPSADDLQGLKDIEVPQGTLIFDPQQISQDDVVKRVLAGQTHELLGHVEPKSEKTMQLVIARDPATGEEIQSSYVSPERAEEQASRFKEMYLGARVETGGQQLEAEMLGRREAARGTATDFVEHPQGGLDFGQINEDASRAIGQPEGAKQPTAQYNIGANTTDFSKFSELAIDDKAPVNDFDFFRMKNGDRARAFGEMTDGKIAFTVDVGSGQADYQILPRAEFERRTGRIFQSQGQNVAQGSEPSPPATQTEQPTTPAILTPPPVETPKAQDRVLLSRRGSANTALPQASAPVQQETPVGPHGRFTHLLHKSYPHPQTGQPLPAFLTEPTVRKAVGLPDVSPEVAKTTTETQKVREAIAQRMRAPRSSYLGVNDFQRFINLHKDKLSNDAVDAFHATQLEHEDYGKKLDSFLNHPEVDKILTGAQNGTIPRGAKTRLAQIAKQHGVSKASSDAALESVQRATQAVNDERGSARAPQSTASVKSSDSSQQSSLRRPNPQTPEPSTAESRGVLATNQEQANKLERERAYLQTLKRQRAATPQQLARLEELTRQSRHGEVGSINLSDIHDAFNEFQNVVSENLSHLKRSNPEAYRAVLKLAGTQSQVTVGKLQGQNASFNVAHALNVGDVIMELESAGLAKAFKGTPLRTITVGGRTFPAATMKIGSQTYLMPRWLKTELEPSFSERREPNILKRVVRVVNRYGMSGPLDAVFHSANLAGTLVAGTPFLGPDFWSRTIGNLPLFKLATAIVHIAKTDPLDPANDAAMQELAEIGALPSRYGQESYDKGLAAIAGGRRVRLGLGPLLSGPKGIDARARIIMLRIAKQINPNATPEQLAEFVGQLGQYNRALESAFARGAKGSELAPFFTAGSQMLKNGVKIITGTTPNPGRGFTRRASVRLQQQLSGGMIGLIGLWILASLAYRKKLPWDDPESRFLQIPLNSDDRRSGLAKTIYGDNNRTAYVGFGFFSPLVERGARALGISGAYDTALRGGSIQQMFESGLKDAANSFVHPLTTGPFTRGVFTAAMGAEPQLRNMRDKGRFKPTLWPANVPEDAGLGRNILEGALDVNPFVANVAHNLGIVGGSNDQKKYEDANKWLKMGIDLGVPRLDKGTQDVGATRGAIQQERRQMESLAGGASRGRRGIPTLPHR